MRVSHETQYFADALMPCLARPMGRARANSMDHNRKTVIVTGASQGIGAGIGQAFLARGYDVLLDVIFEVSN
jgi:3-oxoacyl-ACP reductase-like protein